MMQPTWCPYEQWEDYQNGMYQESLRKDIIKACEKLFRDSKIYEHMKETVNEWKNSALVNLSHNVYNKRAWIGQATCCRVCGATISETVTAWCRISSKDRELANIAAESVIAEYEGSEKKLRFIQTKMF